MTQTKIWQCAQALFEYEHGTGIPVGSRWAKTDPMTKDKYFDRSKIVLDTVNFN